MPRENSWPLQISILSSLLVLLLCTLASVFAQASHAVALRVAGDVPNHPDLSIADIAAFQRLVCAAAAVLRNQFITPLRLCEAV